MRQLSSHRAYSRRQRAIPPDSSIYQAESLQRTKLNKHYYSLIDIVFSIGRYVSLKILVEALGWRYTRRVLAVHPAGFSKLSVKSRITCQRGSPFPSERFELLYGMTIPEERTFASTIPQEGKPYIRCSLPAVQDCPLQSLLLPPISPLGFSLKCMIMRTQQARVLLWPSRRVELLEHLQMLTWLGGIQDAGPISAG